MVSDIKADAVGLLHITGVYLIIQRKEGAELAVVGLQLLRCRSGEDDDQKILGEKGRGWSMIVLCCLFFACVFVHQPFHCA